MSKEKPQINEALRLIPWWAYLFAAVSIAVTGPFVYFHGMKGVPHAATFNGILSVVASCVIAFFVLLIGYVNRDAKRRNMNSTLWTLLVIFIPNAIGFMLYFLLRQPLMVKCPQCKGRVQPSFNFCPTCRYALRPTCPKCAHAGRPGDVYCPQCGYEWKGRPAG